MEFVPLTKQHDFSKDWEKFNLSKNIEKKHLGYVLEDGGTVGYWRGVFKPEYGTAYLKKLMVKEERRGRGYGAALMKHFEKTAKELNCPLLWARTSPENKNVEFYEKMGFFVAQRMDDIKIIIVVKKLIQ